MRSQFRGKGSKSGTFTAKLRALAGLLIAGFGVVVNFIAH